MGVEKMHSSEIPESQNRQERRDTKNQWLEHSRADMDKAFASIFEKFGLTKSDSASDGEKKYDPDKKAYDLTDEELYDELGLDGDTREKVKEKNGVENEDGTYTDNTGKTYDSFADWLRAKYTEAKKAYSHAESCDDKANKEYARYKNAEENGESDAEKPKHYLNSQKYYEYAKQWREKADSIMDEITGKEFKTRELTDQEKAELKEKLGWTDKQLDKCTIDDNGIIHYKTDREDMDGKTSENGVRYERKTVVISGVTIEGVFPVFESKFDAQLPEDLLKASNAKQFKECNQQLQEAIEKDSDLRDQFDENQLEDIQNGKTPEGYVWHHNEESGKMQLVKIEDHDRTQGGAAHTGGKTLWGGGYGNSVESQPDKTNPEDNNGGEKDGTV